jgi:hypothetical protein
MATDMKELFERHFVYEVWMLIETRERLLGEAYTVLRDDVVVRNALIESFCVHARNLIRFFTDKDHAKASSFVDVAYAPFANGAVASDLVHKLSDQIMHLGRKRTADPREKIDGRGREELFVKLGAEVANFLQHLKPEYRALWPAPTLSPSTPPRSSLAQASCMEGTSLGITTTTTSTST